MFDDMSRLKTESDRFQMFESEVKHMSLDEINQQLDWVKPYLWWHEHHHGLIILIELIVIILLAWLLHYLLNYMITGNFITNYHFNFMNFATSLMIVLFIVFVIAFVIQPDWYTHRMHPNQYYIVLENAREHLMKGIND